MNSDIFANSMTIPKLVISSNQRIIVPGQTTDTAFYVLSGQVLDDYPCGATRSVYSSGDIVCVKDFLISKTYSKSYMATSGTILICLTVEMFKEFILSGDKFAWSLSKLLAAA